MIKFFRKIRRELFSDQTERIHSVRAGNKFSKYLIYAIGEIILVVIGILIALAINNWQENQKLHSQEITYLSNLRDDLETQINMLNVYIDYENIIIDHSNDILKHYELNDGFNKMDSVFPKLNDLTTRWTFTNANTTLMQMLNSNQINIIQNTKLREELIGFNQQIDLFTRNTNINNTNLVDNLTTGTFISTGGFASYGNSKRMVQKFNDFYPFQNKIIDDSDLKKTLIEVINEPKNKLEILNKIAYRNTISTLQKSGNEAIKDKAIRLLKLLNEEIELHKK